VDLSRNAGDPDVEGSVDFRARAHELGHYLINLLDEYEFVPAEGPRCPEATNYGYMDHPYEDPDQNPMRSELSDLWPFYGLNPSCQNTSQWHEHGASCWEVFEDRFEAEWGDPPILAPIVRPSDRTDLPDGVYHVHGPNDLLADLDADVGALVQFPVVHEPPEGSNQIILVTGYVTGQPSPNVAVELVKPADFAVVQQGNTADDGLILVFDTEGGDQINAWGIVSEGLPRGPRSQGLWASGGKALGGGGPDTLRVEPVEGEYPLIARVDLGASDLRLHLDFATAFSVPPTLDVRTEGGSEAGIPFTANGSTYDAALSLIGPGPGQFIIRALDAGDRSFFAVAELLSSDMANGEAEESLHGPGGRIELDLGASGVSSALLVSSAYPPLRDGLDEMQIQAGEAHAIAVAPGGPLPIGTTIGLSYPESDLAGAGDLAALEASLRVHRWDPDLREWVHAGGYVDAVLNVVRADIVAAGTYALFTTPTTTDVDSGSLEIPQRPALLGSHPNPFGPSTRIEFALAHAGHVRVSVHDATGRLVALLHDGRRQPGRHVLTWDGTDRQGAQAASGLYFYRIQGPGLDAIGRMTRIR
jgi:hypothetical protein